MRNRLVCALCVLSISACGEQVAPTDAGTRRDGEVTDAGRDDGSALDDGSAPDDAALGDGGIADPVEWVGTPPGPSLGSGEPPVVLWPRPGHAHPDVPFVFTFVAFDPENEALRFALDGAPAGMTVAADGTVRWPSPLPGTYDLVLRVDDGRADAVEVPFTLDVDPSHFVFVATDGRAEATGTIDDPMLDIEAALGRIRDLGYGTVLVRGGTYEIHWTWEVDGHASPLRGAEGTAERGLALRGFPGEAVVLDCGGDGHGLWSAGGDYVLFADLEVRNASSSERGGVVLESHAAAQNVTVRDSDWSRSENCTGFLIRGEEAICHRCRAIDNFDRASDHWNSSNYLVYVDAADTGARYILDSLSSGSVVGFKVKHAGMARLLVHASRSVGDDYGAAVADDGSEVRYCTFESSGTALTMGIADPNEHTHGDVSFHHNTAVDARIGVYVQDGYGDRDPVRVEANVFSTGSALGSTEEGPLMTFVWPYVDAPELGLVMDHNCFAAPDLETGFRFGRDTTSFEGWRAQGLDGASVATGTIDFVDDWRLPAGSPCLALDAGAWR